MKCRHSRKLPASREADALWDELLDLAAAAWRCEQRVILARVALEQGWVFTPLGGEGEAI